MEGILLILISIVPFWLYLTNESYEGENISDREFEVRTKDLGWAMIGVIGIMYFAALLLGCLGRSGM